MPVDGWLASAHFTFPSAAVALVVAALALLLAALAFSAAGKRANPQLRLVGAAFGLFSVKNVFSAYNVVVHRIEHDAIELVLSLFDLAIILLLFLPFVLRRRS